MDVPDLLLTLDRLVPELALLQVIADLHAALDERTVLGQHRVVRGSQNRSGPNVLDVLERAFQLIRQVIELGRLREQWCALLLLLLLLLTATHDTLQ